MQVWVDKAVAQAMPAVHPEDLRQAWLWLLQRANVPIAVTLLNDTNGVGRLVRILPLSPLRSQQSYEVVVIDGEFGVRVTAVVERAAER